MNKYNELVEAVKDWNEDALRELCTGLELALYRQDLDQQRPRVSVERSMSLKGSGPGVCDNIRDFQLEVISICVMRFPKNQQGFKVGKAYLHPTWRGVVITCHGITVEDAVTINEHLSH